MINVFAVFTGKLLQTLQNSSFHKTCYLQAKRTFCTILQRHCNFNFFKIGHDKCFLLFLLENCCKHCKIAVFIKRVI